MTDLEVKLSTLNDLGREHVRRVSLGDNWQDVWHWMVSQNVFSDAVRRHAVSAARRCGLPESCHEDIAQDVMIRWAGLLRRRVDLGYDAEVGDYERWVSLLMRSCSGKAIAQFRDRGRQSSTLDSVDVLVRDVSSDVDLRVDLIMGINQLADPMRYIVMSTARGTPIESIAEKLSLSPRSVYRWLQRGREILQQKMAEE